MKPNDTPLPQATPEANNAAGAGCMARLVRPAWFTSDPACDWHEDADHENGGYWNKCLACDGDFVGHKRRHICRKCHYEAKASYEAMTPETRAAFDAKRDAEIMAFFETNDQAHSCRVNKAKEA